MSQKVGSRTRPPWASLPTLALEVIFRHLNVVQLAQMRLMCRQWNTAICHSPALMRKFVPRFHPEVMFPAANREDQQKVADAVTGRFSEAFVTDTGNIGSMAVSPLWFKLGETIRILHVSGQDGTFAATELLEGLQGLPNLADLQLKISSSEVDFEVNQNFKLEKLEQLALDVDDARFIGLFGKICSGLKVFEYFRRYRENNPTSLTADEILPIVLEHQHSLQKISVKDAFLDCGKFLKQISSADRLQLKALGISRASFKASDFIQLGQAFPTIEELKIDGTCVNAEGLNNLRTSLKQLRSLSIPYVDNDDSKQLKIFLENMPQLEHLNVKFDQSNYSFAWCSELRNISCQNLRTLSLDYFFFEDGVCDFFTKCPNIRSLTLTEFEMQDTRDALQSLSRMNKLEYLEYRPDLAYCVKERDYLKHVKLDRYEITLDSVRFLRTNVTSLALCCPNLVTVELHNGNIEDIDIRRMLRKAPQLTELVTHATQYDLTDSILNEIAKRRRRFQKVHLALRGWGTSEDARNMLISALKPIADVKIETGRYH